MILILSIKMNNQIHRLQISVDHECRLVFIGQESGTVQMFELSEDLNVLASKRVFNSHDVPVNDLALCKKKNWIISGGADGTISISEIGSGVKVSDYRCTIVPKNIDVRKSSSTLLVNIIRSTLKVACYFVELLKAQSSSFEFLPMVFAAK